MIDTFPYREEGLGAPQASVRHAERFLKMADVLLAKPDLADAIRRADVLSGLKVLWGELFPWADDDADAPRAL